MVRRPLPVPPIRGLEPMSLTAWEGRVAAVISLQGCNFNCSGCPVPHLVPATRDAGGIPAESVVDSLHRRRRWLDGVVVSGGEPTLHEGLEEFFTALRPLGLPLRLHTNGSNPSVIRSLLEVGAVDSVAMKLLAPLDPTYSVAASVRVRLAAIYESVEVLLQDGGPHEFRVPWLPGVVEADQIGSAVRTLAGAPRVVLERTPEGAPTWRTLERVARNVGHLVESCVVAGRPARDFGARARSRRVVS